MQYIVDEPIEGFNIYKALQDSKDAGKFEGKTEMAINLLKKNISDDIISECSGISPEELNKLKDQITK